MLMKKGLNNVLLPTLFTVVNNIVHPLLHTIEAQQYCSILLKTVNNMDSKTLFSPVSISSLCSETDDVCRPLVHFSCFRCFLFGRQKFFKEFC